MSYLSHAANVLGRVAHAVDPNSPDSAIHYVTGPQAEKHTREVVAQLADKAPAIDWHALAPEITLACVALLVLIIDLFLKKRSSWRSSNVAAIGLLVSLIPVITLALDGQNRSLFGGAFVVDNYALAFKAFFIIGAYLCVLIGGDYIREGDYFQSEFWFLLLTSVFGMSALASSRDLISLFVALETVTIPTFVMAGWRRRDLKSNEAALKYYLIGVMSSAVMLYGMSFIAGMSGTTLFTGIHEYFESGNITNLAHVAVILTVIGFAFKISAVPFHQWAPDTYEGAPTPVTAFLSVLSKAAGFVGLTVLLQYAFFPEHKIWMPIIFIMVVASLIVGNFTALKENNIVRMLAYSSIAQGGFILLPLTLLAERGAFPVESALQATIVYLIIYLLANIGAFACVIAIARRTHSGELETFKGLGQREPFLAICLSIFLFSLAGIPPFAGWFAKFVMFRSALDVGTFGGVVLAVVAGVASVVAFVYYAGVVKRMWLEEPANQELDEMSETTAQGGSLLVDARVSVGTPPALKLAIVLCVVATIVLGVFPGSVGRVAELVTLLS
ncbi:MAG TPA: NADH-quinone oxidoreductase subunit N [Acidimicrobiia bacterium]|nr:NADH-quinone oxidoreductase subunit N [Acidimicrobiia bacterium]